MAKSKMNEFAKDSATKKTSATKAPKKKTAEVAEALDVPAPVTKLRKLIIKNLGCIGNTPVSIDLDEVVVLVGRNNTGKSTILRAYQLVCGSSVPKLNLHDFPESRVIQDAFPEVELHTKIIQNPPADKWIAKIEGEDIVRERWTWSAPDTAGKRQGFDATANDWVDQVPWGAANVANSRRPEPHRIDAFATPDSQIQEVTKLLQTALKEMIKKMPIMMQDEAGNEVQTPYGKLVEDIGGLQASIVAEATETIAHVQTHLTELIQNVFQGYEIQFDAKAEEDLASCINFFKPDALLRMGPKGGHLSPAQHQGSGARRTLMWAALKYVSEFGTKKPNERPHLLLLDEPELCLHPNAIREACKVLYDLPAAGNWQVMVTTHSPAFIDLSRDNTTVVRVERAADGKSINGTTVFRPEKVKLSNDEKEELKMLNICDPQLCEFFFGGRTVVVEGDSEYTVFRYILDQNADAEMLRDVHIVRARGKATICLIAKILNQFNARYAVLHDSDSPTTVYKKGGKKGQTMSNPAWTNNMRIMDSVKAALDAKQSRLIAMVPNLEEAFFGVEVKEDKPDFAWKKVKGDAGICAKLKVLLHSLLEFGNVVPDECIEWADEQALKAKFDAVNA